VSTKTC